MGLRELANLNDGLRYSPSAQEIALILRTSETGYIQRKLVKAMEDCKVNYDMTVRNAAGVIIEFLYGEDGMDACKIDSQVIPHIDMDMDRIASLYNIFSVDDFKGFLNADLFKELKKNEVAFKTRMDAYHKQILDDREHVIIKMNNGLAESSVMYPVSIARILTNVQNMYAKYNANATCDLTPDYVMDKMEELCTELIVTKASPANKLFNILLRAYLSPKNIIIRHRLTKTAYEAVIEQIRFRFFDALVHPSEMVGVVAAQSIGEPSSQLVLNSFHSAGISSASKSIRGVPRLNELLAVSKNPKSPYMKIFLTDTVRHDRKACLEVANKIRTVRFRDIIASSKIYFDPNDFETHIAEDRAFIDLYKAFYNNTPCTGNSPWILRLEFDRDAMKELNLDMITLHHVLDSFYDENITCMFSDDNASQLIMRVRLNTNEDEKEKDKKSSEDLLTDLKALEHNILEVVPIKGVKFIERVAIEERKAQEYNTFTKTFEEVKEFVVYSDGSNLRDVLALPFVDAPRIFTNDVVEIYDTLGIEAARQALYGEFVDVLTGIQVNYRHLALLVDVMCNRGTILPTSRHGMSRSDVGPLAKCSFEETTDKLIKAGIFSELDKVNGVSANIMLGQIAPAGTGDVTVIMDEAMVSQMDDPIETRQTFEFDDDLDTACAPDVLGMNMPVPTTSENVMRKIDNEIVFV